MKKHLKHSLSLFLAILMLVTLLPVSAMADTLGTDLKLSVNPYGGEEDSIDTISWFKKGLEYYLFLPADCDTSNLTVYFNNNKVSVDGEELISGGATDAFAGGGKFILKCGITLYTLRVMVSENVPAVYLETESGSLDYIHASKDNKEPANIRIYDDGEMQFDGALKQIKGRGNATWDYDKKPYNIKFDSKTSVLGMEKAKKWTMLASSLDPTIIRNPLAWHISDVIGLYFASDYRIVDLYINGDYKGDYIICESVEIGSSRVDITDLTKATEKVNSDDLENYPVGGTGEGGTVQLSNVYPSAKWVNIPNNPDDITGGYLLECEISERLDNEISGFVTNRAQAVTVKEPECASEAQVKYISGYWQEAEDAIWSEDGYNSLGKHYSEYFDMDALVNMYILAEISNNIDSGISSTYFYKDVGGKLVASPVWDYDRALGDDVTRMNYNFGDPGIWTANRLCYDGVGYDVPDGEGRTIFNQLYRHEDFKALVSARWSEVSEAACGAETVNFINDLTNTIHASAVMNGIRWQDSYSSSKYDKAVQQTVNFITGRKTALDKGFAPDAPQLYYDVNGGKGWLTDNKIYSAGEKAWVKDLIRDFGEYVSPPSANYYFAGWNTAADGSGTTYIPGTGITLNGTVTLYAQWKPIIPEKDKPDVPDTPDIPDVPDTPDTPETPDNPTVLDKIKDIVVNNPVSNFVRDSVNKVTGFFKGLFK